jgi:hypothetical protein
MGAPRDANAILNPTHSFCSREGLHPCAPSPRVRLSAPSKVYCTRIYSVLTLDYVQDEWGCPPRTLLFGKTEGCSTVCARACPERRWEEGRVCEREILWEFWQECWLPHTLTHTRTHSLSLSHTHTTQYTQHNRLSLSPLFCPPLTCSRFLFVSLSPILSIVLWGAVGLWPSIQKKSQGNHRKGARASNDAKQRQRKEGEQREIEWQNDRQTDRGQIGRDKERETRERAWEDLRGKWKDG